MIYLRIKLTHSDGTVSYLPDENGHKNLYYVNDSRLDTWNSTWCVADKKEGSYSARLQWRSQTVELDKVGRYLWGHFFFCLVDINFF